MTGQTRRTAIITFFALLLIIDWLLYFRHAGHFFPGDTTFALGHRATSFAAYLGQFVVLNSGWYRPLAQELMESILYPFAGLHPVPYRIPVYALFVAVTAFVYRLTLDLTRRHDAAAIATFFFTIHTANAYTTYDISFMPELLFGLCYIGATVAFLKYLRNESKQAYWLSLLAFGAALLSKESAVTLPGVLFAAAIAFDPRPRRWPEKVKQVIRSTAPHAALLVVYLAYAVGYLDVQGVSVRGLFDQSQKPAFGDYTPVFNSGVLTDVRLAGTWAFNIPRGWWGQWQHLSPAMLRYVKFFRLLVLALLALMLIRPERNIVLFGIAWFWIALLPALPIATHFAPYYLFVPIMGLSLSLGIAFALAYDLARSIQPQLAAAAIVLLFGCLLYVNSRAIRGDIRDNPILGDSARLAYDTLTDLRRLYPALPAGTVLFFVDGKQSIQWAHDSGNLIKMAYGNDEIKVLYQSGGDPLPAGRDVEVVEIHDGHLFSAPKERKTLAPAEGRGSQIADR